MKYKKILKLKRREDERFYSILLLCLGYLYLLSLVGTMIASLVYYMEGNFSAFGFLFIIITVGSITVSFTFMKLDKEKEVGE